LNTKIFLKLFKYLKRYILKGISKKRIGINSKGQITKFFDKFIEDKIIFYFKKNLKINAEIISEELSQNIIINSKIKGKKHFIIIDPVDGSDNYIFNIPFVCLAIAIFDEKLNPVFSFVGNYFSGDYVVADKNKIEFSKKEKSQDTETVLFLTFSGIKKQKFKKFEKILSMFKHIRSLGATAGEMLLVARGDIDAFIDMRNKLTLENFAPFFLIAEKTGAQLTDENGEKIKIKNLSLAKGYNIIFSKNKNIHKKIVSLLR